MRKNRLPKVSDRNILDGMNIEKFLARLRLLIDSGTQQKDLATMSGVSQSVISKLYTGKRANPRASTLMRLWPFVMARDAAGDAEFKP